MLQLTSFNCDFIKGAIYFQSEFGYTLSLVYMNKYF